MELCTHIHVCMSNVYYCLYHEQQYASINFIISPPWVCSMVDPERIAHDLPTTAPTPAYLLGGQDFAGTEGVNVIIILMPFRETGKCEIDSICERQACRWSK